MKNDGAALKQLLEDECSASEVKHIGNFMFAAEARRVKLHLFTEPVNGGEEYIRITGYSINL